MAKKLLRAEVEFWVYFRPIIGKWLLSLLVYCFHVGDFLVRVICD